MGFVLHVGLCLSASTHHRCSTTNKQIINFRVKIAVLHNLSSWETLNWAPIMVDFLTWKLEKILTCSLWAWQYQVIKAFWSKMNWTIRFLVSKNPIIDTSYAKFEKSWKFQNFPHSQKRAWSKNTFPTSVNVRTFSEVTWDPVESFKIHISF